MHACARSIAGQKFGISYPSLNTIFQQVYLGLKIRELPNTTCGIGGSARVSLIDDE
jgi:hypothetical protein